MAAEQGPGWLADRLDEALAEQCVRYRVPSLSAAVAADGALLWAGASGEAGAASRYRIGSTTKTVTAVAVLRLVEQGRLGLDDPIGSVVVDAPVPRSSVRQLLNHTSGLPAEPGGDWWERSPGLTWDELVGRGLQPLFPAGARYHYSNVGFGVLGRALEVIHGRRWDEVVADEVLDPLGLTGTSIDQDADSVPGWAIHPTQRTRLAEPVQGYLAMGAAGELWSTPSELVRLGMWLSCHDESDDRVLSRTWRQAMGTPGPVVDQVRGPWTTAQGLGLRVVVDAAGRWVGHGGSVPGFQAALRADPETGLAVAVCGNATHSAGNIAELAAIAKDWWMAAPERAGGASEGGVQAAEDWFGTWYWGPRPFELRGISDGVVELSGEDADRSERFARLGDRWVGVSAGYWLGEELRVLAGTDGVASLDVGSFCFTRTPYDPGVRVPGGVDERGWVEW